MNEIVIGAKPIRQRDERSLAEAIRITGFTFALATPFFVFMGLSANHVEEEYRLSRSVEQRRQLQRDRERLQLTRDSLLSPDTVRAVATEKLGMVEEAAQEFTVGVAPEEKGAGEPGSRGAGEEKKEQGGATTDPTGQESLTAVTPNPTVSKAKKPSPTGQKSKVVKKKNKGRAKR